MPSVPRGSAGAVADVGDWFTTAGGDAGDWFDSLF